MNGAVTAAEIRTIFRGSPRTALGECLLLSFFHSLEERHLFVGVLGWAVKTLGLTPELRLFAGGSFLSSAEVLDTATSSGTTVSALKPKKQLRPEADTSLPVVSAVSALGPGPKTSPLGRRPTHSCPLVLARDVSPSGLAAYAKNATGA